VRVITHGRVQGGKFGSPALAGFTSSILGPTADGGGYSLTDTPLGDVIQSAIVGRTASKIGGEKFANGAMTGAFFQILNHGHQGEATRQDGATLESRDSLSGFEIDQQGATKIFNKLGLGNVPDAMNINMDGIDFADELLAAAVPADQLIKLLEPSPVQRLSPMGIIRKLFLNSARGHLRGNWHKKIDTLDIGMRARSGIKYNPEFMTSYRELPRE